MSRYFFPSPRFSRLLGLVLSLFGLSAGAATFTVANLNDSGPTSERRATLADLPLAAQYTLSAQFGREDPTYPF